MKKISLLTLGLVVLINFMGCSNGEETGHTHDEEGSHTHSEATHTHAEEAGEMQEEVTEQTSFSKSDTLNKSSKGVQLTLYFDNQAGTFTGSLENTTAEPLCGISVTTSAEAGSQLASSEPVDLEAGENTEVQLSPENTSFTHWSAQTTMQSCGESTHTHEDGETHEDHQD